MEDGGRQQLDVVVKCEPDSSTSSTTPNINDKTVEIRKSIAVLINEVAHAFLCQNRSCARHNCSKVKWIISHSKYCRRRFATPPCGPCTHLFSILCYHAHICKAQPKTPACIRMGCPKIKARLSLLMRQNKQTTRNFIGPEASILPSTSASLSSSSAERCTKPDGVEIQIKQDPDKTE